MNVVASVLTYLPVVSVLLGIFSLVAHLVVVHRLNCGKPLLKCLSEKLTPSILQRLVSFLEEKTEMKYKTFDTAHQNEKSQKFSKYVDDYVLDPATNLLEKLPRQKNIQEYINSFVDCALERAFERFMPSKVIEDDSVADYTQRLSDLGTMADAMDVAEEYRERFGLPDTLSVKEIYEYVDREAKALKEKLSAVKEDRNSDETQV